ncbi:hypothetical protein PIB30_013268 [Stylosanthes scabra]|uniref:DUF674 domain-containing protein n=1 Tax=Stylosanthes scabra TaxID=79078 RepID=A0ABU6R6K8_9FABA|nr:hypothetical protein [Stylosanthes scabra]
MASTTTKLTMKLLVDTKQEKVLFAEASKEVVDFLFHLLQLPLATVVRLLTPKGVVGCIGNLYQSVENLNDIYYLQPNQPKHFLLNPKIPPSSPLISAALLPPNGGGSGEPESITPTKMYRCGSCSSYSVTDLFNAKCSACSFGYMNREVKYISKNDNLVKDSSSSSSWTNNGFVKEVVTYTVRDDLVVEPMSTISCITLLNQFSVKDVGVLKEKVVDLGMAEGIKLLKASLESETVLTSVFLKNSENTSSHHLL